MSAFVAAAFAVQLCNSAPPDFPPSNSDRFTQNLSAFKQEVKAILV
jgi:hypothetical protein